MQYALCTYLVSSREYVTTPFDATTSVCECDVQTQTHQRPTVLTTHTHTKKEKRKKGTLGVEDLH